MSTKFRKSFYIIRSLSPVLRIWLSTDTALWPYMGAGRGPAWRQEEAPSTSSSVLAVKVKEEEWCSPPVTRYTCTSVHSHLKLECLSSKPPLTSSLVCQNPENQPTCHLSLRTLSIYAVTMAKLKNPRRINEQPPHLI